MKKIKPYANVRLRKYIYVLHWLGILSDEEKEEVIRKLNNGQKGLSR